MSSSLIPVGISSCLLGNAVRHNGGHKLSSYCRDTLGEWFDYRPVCPEMSIGLGTPRPTIRLVDAGEGPRAIQTGEPETDLTADLQETARQFTNRYTDLCGFIFMEKSPSCGVWRVKRYNPAGNPLPADARGIFAATLMDKLPLLPVEEAGRLNDADLRENFILRIYTWHDWHTTGNAVRNAASLVKFWTRYKYLVLAHDEKAYRQIGRLVAQAGSSHMDALSSTFFEQLMTALAKPSTKSGNINALEHLRGFIKQDADSVEKNSLTRSISDYRHGIVPLIVPLALLRHLLDRHPAIYAHEQKFLQPYPDQLGLRNHK